MSSKPKSTNRKTFIKDKPTATSETDKKKSRTVPRKSSTSTKHEKKEKTMSRHAGKKKRDEQVHVNRKLPAEKKNKKEIITLPRNQDEFSSNWKQLSKKLEKTSRKRKHGSEIHSDRHKLKRRKQLQETDCDQSENKSNEIWFDDVDEMLIEGHKKETKVTNINREKDSNPLVKPDSYTGLTKAVAIDCEMVGVGEYGKDSILARVSVVNQFGQSIYDTFVKPTETVTDYRTHVSGVRKEDLDTGTDFKEVQNKVDSLIRDRIVVGHALENDFKVLFIAHPKKMIRDTSRFKKFKALFNGRLPSLKNLSDKVLNVKVQEGEHSSVQDAQAAMRLYTMYRKEWEKDIKMKSKRQHKKAS